MLKNYFIISARSLKKNFGYTLINIIGLGLGLATCILLVTWIRHELSYDEFHSKKDRIYRASIEFSFGGQVSKPAVSPTALLPAMLTLPEIETGVRVYNPAAWTPYVVGNGNKLFQEAKFYFADSTFFDVFSFTFLKGNPKKALAQPYSVVLTAAYAFKYFGDDDPIGKTLSVNNKQEYIVTGIIDNIPSNSFLQFDLLGSFNSVAAGRGEPEWWSANYQTFIVPHKNASMVLLNDKINAIASNAVASDISGKGDYVRYNLMLLKDIHLKSEYSGEPEVVSDMKYIIIFSTIAALILIIACMNYINLATARAAERAKEVSVRKVVGAVRKQLLLQFMTESFVITLLGFCLAFVLAQMLLPFFTSLAGKNFSAALFLDSQFILLSILAFVAISLMAGAYPAFVITSFRPVSVLKGNFRSSHKGIWLRQTLVILQFSISMILIVGTFVISKQLDFIQSIKLGYNRENIIVLSLDDEMSEVFETLKTELIRSGAAIEVSRASETPTQVLGSYPFKAEGASGLGMLMTGLIVDEGFVPALGMEIIEGKNFTKEDVERPDTIGQHTFIINESAMKDLNLSPGQSIGKKATMGERTGEIIGVVKDFHFSSLHQIIGPLVLFPEVQNFHSILIKLPMGDKTQTIDDVARVYTELVPQRPFEFKYLDQQYDAMYQSENRMGRVFNVFAVLAISIACLGLLGLVSFAVSQKTKEISIRKVLGASGANIVLLLTSGYTKLVIIASLIGFPVAYWSMNYWLQDFAYKVTVGVWPILIAALACLIIAFLTSSFHAIKATLINPADTLRSE